MKILIILAILAVTYLVYRAATADTPPTANLVETPEVEEVSMPNAEFKNAIRLAVGIAVLMVVLITAAFLL